MKKQSRAVESEDEKTEKRSRVRRKKIQLRESQKKEDPHARNVRQVANRCVFSMICGSAGSKRRLAKAAGAEVAAQSTQEKLHAAVARSTFSIKMYKTHQRRSAFGSWDVEKWHAAVARSTFASQNAKKLTVPAHFWKLRCGKLARRFSEKHISKSKCTKHLSFGAFLEVGLWKICTPL